MVFIFTQASIWILGAYAVQSTVALYGAAAYLVNLVSIPLAIVGAVAPPFIAEQTAQNKHKQLEETLRTMTTLAAVPALIGLGLFVFFGRPILVLVYGDYYQVSAAVLAILSVGKAINVLTGPCEATLNMTGHQRTMMTISILYGLLSIALGWLVVESYGIVGISLVTALMVILQNLTTLILAKRLTGIWTFARIRPF
ncbi:polysaccharide biosynthesis C-terminal domain-containing protein [Chloroflexi bacterium TSY]|nr:polysaccharide biosynthesis C-terminal domain-containing protein [Chloroflexi bacterium TSY]